MASKKKQSEGIALLSMYNDDGDDEMEDAEEEEEEENEDAGIRREEQHDEDDAVAGDARFAAEEDLVAGDADRMAVVDSGNEAAADDDDVSTPAEKRRFGTPTPQQVAPNMVVSSPQQRAVAAPSDSRSSRRGTLTIVDYGHDEVAMSPEPEVHSLFYLN